MINADIYTETIAANGVSRRLFQGAFFKLISATGAVNVRTSTVKLNGLISGQGFEKAPFEFLELTDASGAPNTIKYCVATEGFIDGITGSMQITQIVPVTVSAMPAVTVSSTVPVRSGAFSNALNTVGTASAQLVAANAARSYLMFQNKDAASNLYLSFGVAATIANGIKVQPGGVYEMADVQSTQAIFAIADIANTNVLVVQG